MAEWRFLTNHTQVLLAIGRNSRSTAKELAAVACITERAVQRIIDDLEEEGYIRRFRDGRRNRYEMDLDCPLRHPAQQGFTIGHLFTLLEPPPELSPERAEGACIPTSTRAWRVLPQPGPTLPASGSPPTGSERRPPKLHPAPPNDERR